MFLNEAKGQ
jgi:hypothetical protein